jgi:predicted ATPase/class 3 adenylate cyclase
MRQLPTGMLTFMFTDVVGSTRLWELNRSEMSEAMATHDRILTEEIEAAGGVVVRLKGEGDSFFAVFTRASGSVAAGCAVQRRIAKTEWPQATPIEVRIAIHTGESDLREGDYYGSAPNRCARLRAIAHGGQVLVSGATEALVRDSLPPDSSLADLGEHRLRDMNRPEHVFQLEHPELRRDFPPLKSVGLQVSNLPLQLTGFVGRLRELAEVQGRVVQDRLVTLTGPGGSGKSRVALEAASQLLDRFPDGVWWLDLALLSEASQVPDALAALLGIRQQPGRSTNEALATELATKTALILLDNCEHVVAECAVVAIRVLSSAASIRLLATSREALGIPGERVIPLLGLDDDEAVQLFADRAQLSNPVFEVTERNRNDVVGVCRRLDCIPLALELAAARTRLLSIEQLYERLDHRFAVLGVAGRTVRAQQKTLHATFDWSYELLEAAEKVAFDMLAVCVGGFSLEAADAICGSGLDALTTLSRLVDKSMVLAGQTERGQPRYRILGTLREYGLERLSGTDEDGLARARHLEYFVGLAERANAAGDPSRMAVTFDLEQGNFFAAMEACESAPADIGVRLAVALAPCWALRGQVRTGHAWSERMVARVSPDEPRLAWAYHELGWLALYEFDNERAKAHFERSARLAREANDPSIAGKALNGLALVEVNLDHLDSAQSTLEQALRDLETVNDLNSKALCHHNLGWIAFFKGDYQLSDQHHKRALELRRRHGEPRELSIALANAAWPATRLGRLEEARALLLEAFQLQVGIVDQVLLIAAFHNAGALALAYGDPRQALLLSGAGHSLTKATGVVPPPSYMRWVAEWTATAKLELGPQGEEAIAAGGDLKPEEAIRHAIKWLSGPAVEASPGRQGQGNAPQATSAR